MAYRLPASCLPSLSLPPACLLLTYRLPASCLPSLSLPCSSALPGGAGGGQGEQGAGLVEVGLPVGELKGGRAALCSGAAASGPAGQGRANSHGCDVGLQPRYSHATAVSQHSGAIITGGGVQVYHIFRLLPAVQGG